MQKHKQLLGRLLSVILVVLVLQGCSSSKRSGNSTSIHTTKPVDVGPGTDLQKKYATLIGVKAVDIENKNLYTFIDKWLNTAYSYGGQTSKGIDCSGFTQLLFDAVYKKKIPRTSEAQYNAVSERKNPKEGDLVFFTTIKGKKISHVGLFLQNNKFVSATNQGIAISDITWQYWRDRYVGAGEIK